MSGSRGGPGARRIAAALFCAALAGGCGYSTGLRVAERHRGVSLEIFGNDSYERDLERPLHDEISRALRNLSDAPIEETRNADVLVRGKIHTYQHRSGIRSRDNQLLETGVYIEVEAGLYSRGSEKPRRGPFKAAAAVGYLVGRSENELEARDRALRHIAEELVLDLFAPSD